MVSTKKDPTNLVTIPPVGTTPSATATPKPSVTPFLPTSPTTTPASTGTIPNVNSVPNGSGSAAQGLTYNDLAPVWDSTKKVWSTAYVDPATGGQKWAALLPDSSSATGYSIYTDQTAVRTATIKNLIQQYGSVQKVKDVFFSKGQFFNTPAKVKESLAAGNNEDPVFDQAIDTLIGTQSRTNWLTPTNISDVATFINGRPNYAGTRNQTTVSYTSKDSASVNFDAFTMQELGRHATSDEFNAYYKNLNTYEQTHPTRATVTMDALGVERNRTQLSGPTAEDLKAVMVSSLAPVLERVGKDPSAISKVGGDMAIAMTRIKQHAAEMGVSNIYNDTNAFKAAVSANAPGGSVDSELAKINTLAKTMPQYKQFAPAIDAGYTIKDLATPFQDTMNKYLETNKPLDINNPLIQKGLTGNNGTQMNVNDFTKLVKSQPEWAYTTNAKEDAANYATTLLKQFGFLG